MKGMILVPIRAKCLIVSFLFAFGYVCAEQLPIAVFTTEHGLPSNLVSCFHRDSRGFLWIGTRHGLARHDGRMFVSFDERHGLRRAWIHDIREAPNGQLLVATGSGVHALTLTGSEQGATFELIPAGESGPEGPVNRFLVDRAGNLWCGTTDGLYLMVLREGVWTFQRKQLWPESASFGHENVMALLEGQDNSLWIGTDAGLVRIPPHGEFERYTVKHGLPSDEVRALYQDSHGTVWLGTGNGLAMLVDDPVPESPVVRRHFTAADGLIADRHAGGSGPSIFDLAETPDGRLWAATASGLAEYQPDAAADEPAFRVYGPDHGLSERVLFSLGIDMAGNLWIGTESAGAMKLAREGFSTFGLEDGLGDLRVSALIQDRAGYLFAVSEYGNGVINRFDGRRFEAVRPGIPASIENVGWGWGQVTLQDRNGEWWVPTFDGLCRFPGVESFQDLRHARPVSVYTKRDGLLSNGIFRLFEDSGGDVWLGLMAYDDSSHSGVQRWDRETESFQDLSDLPGMPSDAPIAFEEDGAGNLWIAFYNEGVGRLRNGRFERFPTYRDLLRDYCEDLYLDSEGRLWMASLRSGVIRVDNPESEQPTFTAITPENGLSGDYVRCITEDDSGRLYFGLLEGVDRLDPSTGSIRHFSHRDGLPTTYTVSALTDRTGAVWIGTYHGVSRLFPSEPLPVLPPTVWIQRLRIAGETYPLSPLGSAIVDGLVLNPAERQLEIEVSGLDFTSSGELEFQYRLDGSSTGWSRPNPTSMLNFASLAPGKYRLEIRAVNREGHASHEPAVVMFRVLPQFFKRGWFLILLAGCVAWLAYTGHRVRIKRMIELERVKTRIATDLHDDIGASLSQVSILSEVARRQVEGDDPQSAGPLLEQIAQSARDLVDSMSDIVWAVNPKRDRTADLVQRMRLFASDTLSGRGIALRFASPEDGKTRKLDIELRRQVYLVFKEAVHNAIRHSGCKAVEIALTIDGRDLTLCVSDDGCGFDPGAQSEGNGLESMRERAASLGGVLEFRSGSEAAGSTVELRVPLGSIAPGWWKRRLYGKGSHRDE